MILKTLGLLLLGLLAGGGWVAYDAKQFFETPIEMPADGLVYEVKPGATVKQLAADLQGQGLLQRPLHWEAMARWTDRGRLIKAGEYRITGAYTPAELLEQFISGKTIQYSHTLVEGWSFKEVLVSLAGNPRIEETSELQNLTFAEIMTQLGEPDLHPEGWFYPDTYNFPRGTTGLEFLSRALKTMQARLMEEWEQREEGLPLKTPYEALILASIVEKETGAPEERPQIAAVFISRLRQGMLLQTDPTVIYGIGDKYDGNIRTRDLKTDTPYNTYTRKGLTPTPIAMPGGDAIHAALHPADTRALFFVARGDGSHEFTETYQQHRKAVIKYQLGGDASRYPSE